MFATRLLKAGVAAVFGLTLLAGAAQAASVSSQLFLGNTNQWSDNSAEFLNVDGGAAGFLDIFDSLRGILDINTVENLDAPGAPNALGLISGNNELSGIFEIVVTGLIIVTDPNGSCAGIGTDCSGGVLDGDETAIYSFGPSAAFVAEFGLAAGTMIALFEDPIIEYTRLGAPGTIPALETNVTNGTLVLELGFDKASNFWVAGPITVDVSLAGTIPPPGNAGFFNLGISIVGVNLLFGDNQLVPCFDPLAVAVGAFDFCASGSVLGTAGVATPYDVFDNVDFVFHPVPEPGILGLFGIGLLGLGFFARRRRPS